MNPLASPAGTAPSPVDAADDGAQAPVPAVVAGLFAALHEHGVRYCHWKSNEHLAAGLAGETDLDLLIDRIHAAPAQQLLQAHGFKRFQATEATGYPAIEDYLALDPRAGRLCHLHVHYRLVAGQPHLKGYRLPWEDRMLETRVRDAATGVYVADPNLEMLVLLVRLATKIRLRDVVLQLLGRRYVRGGAAVEYRWLKDRIDPARSSGLCNELLGTGAVTTYADLLTGAVTLRQLLRFRSAASSTLARWRLYGRVVGALRQAAREAAWLVAGLNRRALALARPVRRTVPTGGIMVAVVGADGSGKSTVARDVAARLATKLDVLLVYFGSGDGQSSALRWPLRAGLQLLKRLGLLRSRGAGPRARAGDPRSEWQRPGRLWGLARWAWALSLAAEKRRKLQAAWRARNRGMIVVTDRFPQVQVAGYNDGPLLTHYVDHPSSLLRRLARWEAEPYRWADQHPPDVIVKLDVSPPTALRRKPEMSLIEAERRVRTVRGLVYPRPASVVVVDADRAYAPVLRDVLGAVWQRL